MVKLPNVSRRKGSRNLQARLRVPADLVKFVGRKELTKSLGTSDEKLARTLSAMVLANWESSFEDLRQRRAFTEADLKAAVVEHYRRELEADSTARINRATSSDLENAKAAAVERIKAEGIDLKNGLSALDASLDYLVLRDQLQLDADSRSKRHAKLVKDLGTGETALIRYAADEFITRHKLTIEQDSSEYRELCHRLLRGEIEFLKRTFERDKGDFSGRPTDPLLSDTNLVAMDMTSFDAIIAKQAELSAKGLGGGRKAPKTISKYHSQTRSFAKWRGSSRAATVTLEEVEQWRDQLLRSQSRKTVRDKVATIRAVLGWGQAQSKGKMFPNGFPLKHLDLPVAEVRDSAEKTYTLGQARKILKAAREQQLPYRRWLPWLAAWRSILPAS